MNEFIYFDSEKELIDYLADLIKNNTGKISIIILKDGVVEAQAGFNS